MLCSRDTQGPHKDREPSSKQGEREMTEGMSEENGRSWLDKP